MLKYEGYQSTTEIDARLSELEDEKNQLLALRKQLQQPSLITPDSKFYTPKQKIPIFKGLFRGRTDIFANRWQNKQGRSGYSVACNNEWVQGICNKPRVKCQDCNHRQFTELNNQVIYSHLAGQKVAGLYPLMHDNNKDNTVSEIVQGYGHVIVDECHHVSAPRFEMVLNEV